MNREAIEMLFQQNLSTVKEFVKMLFDSLKGEVKVVKCENDELRKSLEYTQAELQDMRKCLEEQRGMTTHRSSHGEADENSLSERVRSQEDYSRRQNVIVEGLNEKSDENRETLQASVSRFFQDKLNVRPDIDVIHRIGRHTKEKPRLIIVQFKTFRERQECLRAAPKLKGTNINVNEDVCKATLDIRKSKMGELKERKRQGYIAYFSGSKLITKNRYESTASKSMFDVSTTSQDTRKTERRNSDVGKMSVTDTSYA